MGGDQGPSVVVAGLARSAQKNKDLGFILHGPKDVLEPLVRKRKLEDRCEIRDAVEVVNMEDKPRPSATVRLMYVSLAGIPAR